MEQGGNIISVFNRLKTGLEIIQKNLNFSFTDSLGYITTCPTNLGTGMRASVHLRIQHLMKDIKKFEDIKSEYFLDIRGIHGEHSESDESIYDISNKRRLGYTEI